MSLPSEAMGEVKPRVVLFDDSGAEIFLELAVLATHDADWTPEDYTIPGKAEKALRDNTPDALITGLGSSRPFFGSLPASGLIRLSNELEIPRAILSGHPDADNFVRADSSDIFVPKTRPELIRETLSAWLVSLAEENPHK